MSYPISTYTTQKLKSRNGEDAVSTRQLSNGYLYTGVFDGHNGAKAAGMCAQIIPELIERLLPKRSLLLTLKVAFKEVDALIPDESGSTATVLVTKGAYIVIAHVGDSRAVLCRNNSAIDLTEDHRLCSESENARLRASEVRLNESLIIGSRVQGLMLTRSIGDHMLTSEIAPYPIIQEFRRTSEDQYIIIATDGLWDVCSGKQAIRLVEQQNLCSAADISTALVEYSVGQYERKGMRMDDITCTVLYLQHNPDGSQPKRLSAMFERSGADEIY